MELNNTCINRFDLYTGHQVAVVGDNRVRYSPGNDCWYITGSTIDVGVCLSNLGIRTSIITTLTDNALGTQIEELLLREGLDVSRVTKKQNAAPLCRSRNSSPVRYSSDDETFAADHLIVHSSGTDNAELLLRETKKSKTTLISYDYAENFTGPHIAEMDGIADIGFFFFDSFTGTVQSFIRQRIRKGMKIAVILIKSQEGLVCTGNEYQRCRCVRPAGYRIPETQHRFIAGFLSGFCIGYPVKECLILGLQLSLRTSSLLPPIKNSIFRK